MAKLGAAQSNNFNIGVAELRLGPMASANKLTQANSVGLIDEATVAVAQESVELEGGFPRKLVASAIVKQTGTITATLREYSRKNLNVMIGNGVPAAVTAFDTTATADILVGASTISIPDGDGANFSVGDIVVIYQDGKPESVSVVRLTSVNTAPSPDTIGFAANSLSQGYVVADGTVHIYKANATALGNVTQVNYFAASLIQQSSSGKPMVWNFWKCAVGGNMDYATNAKDFASSKMELKILEPSATDVAGDLAPIAPIVANYPFGLVVTN